MRKEVMLIIVLLVLIIITACDKLDISKLSDKDLVRGRARPLAG